MIVDNIKNLGRYLNNKDYLSKINDFVQKSKAEDFQEGRYLLDDENLIAMIQKYETKKTEECKFESHIEYIDIQYIERGQEIINWIDISQLRVNGQYNDIRDILFYNPNFDAIDLKMKEDMFAIFLKHDGHRARCIMEHKSNVKKILFKIKINKTDFYE